MNSIPVTWLYAPASNERVLGKALESDADVVIVDLEDAVAAERKREARENLEIVERYLRQHPGRGVEVRVNAWGTPWAEDDYSAVAKLPDVVTVRVPKAEDVQHVVGLCDQLGAHKVSLLLESALGIENAFDLAQCHDNVMAIGLGEADLKSDTGISDESGLTYARSRVVIAARAAGLRAPAMSAFVDLNDLDALERSCRMGRTLGFVGRAAIHPKQLAPIRKAFAPRPDEIARAAQILETYEEAESHGLGVAVMADGQFIDAAMLEQARRTIALGEIR